MVACIATSFAATALLVHAPCGRTTLPVALQGPESDAATSGTPMIAMVAPSVAWFTTAAIMPLDCTTIADASPLPVHDEKDPHNRRRCAVPTLRSASIFE